MKSCVDLYAEDGFMRVHFGTDMLVASWLYLITTIIATIVAFLYLLQCVREDRSDEFLIVIYAVETASLFLYVIGCEVMLLMSYPENFMQMMSDIGTTDSQQLTWLEANVTGNYLLAISWSFLLGTVVLLIIPIYGMALQDMSILEGLVSIVLIGFLSVLLGLWMHSCRPDQMAENKGRGSSYFYDYLCCCRDCCNSCVGSCTSQDHFSERYAGSDFVVGSWAVFVVAVFSMGYTIYLVAVHRFDVLDFVWLGSSFGFLLASYLFAISVMPGNAMANAVWVYCCCGARNPRDEDEERAVLHALRESHRRMRFLRRRSSHSSYAEAAAGAGAGAAVEGDGVGDGVSESLLHHDEDDLGAVESTPLMR